MKRFLSLLVVFAMLVACVPNFVSASYEPLPDVITGSFGNGVTWELDSADQHLYISGEGDIPDLEDGERSVWYDYASHISTLTIGDSIRWVGKDAFRDLYWLEKATVGSGVYYVAEGAFSNCENLGQIWILNPNCIIDREYGTLGQPELSDVTVYAPKFSDAELFAQEFGYGLVSLLDCEKGWHDPIQTILREVTCTEDGEASYVCKECSYSYTAILRSWGHSYQRTELVGYDLYSCKNCPASYTVITAVPIEEGETTTTEPFCCMIKYFVFTPAYSHDYIVSSYGTGESGGAMLFIHLYDEDGNTLMYNHDMTWDNSEPSVSYYLEAGKQYYIGVGSSYQNRYQAICTMVKAQYNNLEETTLSVGSCWEKGQILYTCACGCGYSYVEETDYYHETVDGLCTLCGCDTNVVVYHTLNLASDISANLLVKKELLEGYDMDTVYMESYVEIYDNVQKKELRVIITRPVDKGDYYYFTIDGLTAVNMNDSIASILYGEKNGELCYSPMDDYSIAEYAYNQLENPNADWKLRTLCADMLRYGAKAQIFKGYRLDNLADSAMTDMHLSWLSDSTAVEFGNNNVVRNDCENATVKWVGKSLDLKSKVNVKFIFSLDSYTGELSELSLRVRYLNSKDEETTIVLEEAEVYNEKYGFYAFTLDSLLAAELRTVLYAQIFAGDEPVSCTVEYSADTYGNNKKDDLLELCIALFAYSDSARAFFDE